ncbi:hypothetical protein BV20DRAFT_984025 [Pilatotrama ljubarskyi]|nr:hypothetical protein BV20DRAFT_984025 [Pilatotrama ljubarskyi]
MPHQSRPVSFGILDHFDNSAGLFSLPLEYHDLFRIFHDLSRYFPVTRFVNRQGLDVLQADPFAVELITRLAADLLLRITAASHGGSLPLFRAGWNVFRRGSLEELGLVTPPLFDLLNRWHGRLPFGTALPSSEFRERVDELCEAVSGTREWLGTAQGRTAILAPRVGWNWLYSARTASGSFHSSSNTNGEPRAEEEGLVPDGTVIPHPVLSSTAQNALIPHPNPDGGAAISSSAEPSSSTALIPHPIYRPGAQNALVPSRPPTPWAGPSTGAVAPPNSPELPSSPPPPYSNSVYSEDSSSSGTYYTIYETDETSEASDEEGPQPEYHEAGVQTNPIYISDSSDDEDLYE